MDATEDAASWRSSAPPAAQRLFRQALLGKPTRRRPIGNQPAEAFAVPRHEPIESIRDAAADPCVADHPAVAPHEAPACEPLGFRQRLEERLRVGVAEREDG
jgi:cytosine/adenosine deaminase-related metal-dependent hydrolase